ncbi:MAG: DNA primase small subunit domain-containing protein [archaeon]
MDTKSYMRKRYSEFYEKKKIIPPKDFQKREFGAGWERKIQQRHLSFKNELELKNYLVSNVPFYFSYSSACYEFPGATSMEKKNFLGFDLVFEFDQDCEHGKPICSECLNKAKEKAINLVENFLIPDFGISEKDISYVFSGNRGYHIYVQNEEVFHLSKDSKKQIVDYLCGNLDVSFMSKKIKKGNFLPFGWYGKILKEFHDLRKLTKSKISKILEKYKNDIDVTFTIDQSKLIRMPSTIHGTSSLLCVFVRKIESFDPLKHAVAFYNYPIKVKILENIPEFELNEQPFGPFIKDSIVSVPEYCAMLLFGNKKAEFISD